MIGHQGEIYYHQWLIFKSSRVYVFAIDTAAQLMIWKSELDRLSDRRSKFNGYLLRRGGLVRQWRLVTPYLLSMVGQNFVRTFRHFQIIAD